MIAVGAKELLQVADAVAVEKSIDREEVVSAMELAVQRAARAKYGMENDIRVVIDRKTGEMTISRYQEAVADEESLEDESKQILIDAAKEIEPDIEVGGFIIEELPPVEFGRITAQAAKQVIVQRVREAERRRQYHEFKDRVGEIINGVVKRIDYGNVTVELSGRAEAIIRRDETIPRENFKPNERVRAYIYDVVEDARGPQIFLSRTRPEFLKALFAQEVPEIYDEVIEIVAAARDPGSRAKIAVASKDPSIDPVGACVGMRGSRVQAVVTELQGEKIDIIPYTADLATFIVNALAPAEASKVLLDEDSSRIEVVVPDDDLSKAIGSRGQNVRLACMLSGWDIDIMAESNEAERRAEETKIRSAEFMEALDVDDVLSQLLVVEGFATVEDIALTPIEELAMIQGFDEDIAAELQNRAATFINERNEALEKEIAELGVEEEMIEISGLPDTMIVKLGREKIITRDDLADLAGDELVEILGEKSLTETEANEIIMAARAHWFADEDAAAAEAAEDEAETEAEETVEITESVESAETETATETATEA